MTIGIRVQNFQSIEDVFVSVDGFTVITGGNNSGKTALMRAVLGTFSNPGGDAFVRHGTKNLHVEIQFDDGNVVVWEKGPKVKPTYVINGKTLHPGRAVPDEVQALGIGPIQAGTSLIWPQIAPQFTGQVFLLDLPGSGVAEAVADVDRVGKLTKALKLAESDKRAAASELKVRRRDQEKQQAEIEEYAGLDVLETTVATIETRYATIRDDEASVSILEDIQSRMTSAQQEVDALTGIQEVRCPDEAVVAKARRVFTTLDTLQDLQGRMESAQADVAHLQGVEAIPCPGEDTVAEVREVGREVVSLEDIRARLVMSRGLVLKFDGIELVEVPGETDPLFDDAERLRELVALRTRLEGAQDSVRQAAGAAGVASSVDLDGASELAAKATKVAKALSYLETLQGRLSEAQAELYTLDGLLEQKQREAAEAVEEVSSILGGLGTCPVCNASAKPHTH